MTRSAVVFGAAVGLYLLWGPLPDVVPPPPKGFGGVVSSCRFGVFRYAAVENHTYYRPYQGPPWKGPGGQWSNPRIEFRSEVEYPISYPTLLKTVGPTAVILAVAWLGIRRPNHTASAQTDGEVV